VVYLPRIVLSLLVISILAGACTSDPEVSLTQLANEEPPAESELVEESVRKPLLTFVANRPAPLLERVTAALPLLMNTKEADDWNVLLASWTSIAGLYGELHELTVTVDESDGRPGLGHCLCHVVVKPSSSENTEILSEQLSKALSAICSSENSPEQPQPNCTVDDDLLLCSVGNRTDNQQQEVLSRARKHLTGTDTRVLADFSVGRWLTVGEQAVTTPLFWAVIPEEILHLDSISLTLDATVDRLAFSCHGTDSEALRAIFNIFQPVTMPLVLPSRLPVVAWSAVSDFPKRVARAQEFWDSKFSIPKKHRVETFINDTWKSQLVELASGPIGVALVGDLEPLKLNTERLLETDCLVYFILPAEQKAMQDRIKHIFSKKHFILEDDSLASGEIITRSFWRSKYKKSKRKRERLSWYVRDGVWFFGKEENLRKLIAWHHEGDTAPLQMTTLSLDQGDVMRLSISPGRLLQHVVLKGKDAGLAANLALGMAKSSFVQMKTELKVHLNIEKDGSQEKLVFIVDHLLAAWDGTMARTEGLFKLLSLVK
jgi:hypothetical protein